MSALRTPTGASIVGIIEHIQCTALIDPKSFTRAGAGEPSQFVSFDYAGESEVDWNSQIPLIAVGERVFVDEFGALWLESQLELEQ